MLTLFVFPFGIQFEEVGNEWYMSNESKFRFLGLDAHKTCDANYQGSIPIVFIKTTFSEIMWFDHFIFLTIFQHFHHHWVKISLQVCTIRYIPTCKLDFAKKWWQCCNFVKITTSPSFLSKIKLASRNVSNYSHLQTDFPSMVMKMLHFCQNLMEGTALKSHGLRQCHL